MTRLALPVLALLLAQPLSAAAQPRPDLDRGLVAAYPLDGDAVDAVTRARAAAIATRPTEDRNGVRGAALAFDGARSAVNLGAALQPARFTIAAWVRPQAVDRVQVVVSKIRNLPGHYQKNLELRIDPGGRLLLHVPSGQGWEAAQGTRAIAPGRWTHVAAVYDGARAQLYVDGAPDGAPLAVRYAQSPTETFLGARPEGGGADGRTAAGPTFFFFGALDDVSIWDRPLGDAELALVAGRGAPPPAPAPPPYAEPSRPMPAPGRAAPVAVYALDGDARDALGGPAGVVAGARPTPDRAGNPGGALAFGGKAHVDLGVRAEPERFTVSFWARPTRADREQPIFSKLSSPPGARERWLELGLQAGRAVLAVPSAGPAKSSVVSPVRLAPGRWTHLAATYDGARAVLYVDGAPAGELRAALDRAPGATFLGARPDAAGRRARLAPLFDGALDDVRIFRGALSPEEVALLARAAERPAPRDGDEDDDGVLLARVGRLVVRFDAACATRDPRRMARAEEKIGRELEAAARDARGDRALAQRLQQTLRELERERGQYDAVSLDRKRATLTALADALWADLVRELDEGDVWPAPGEEPPSREGW